MINVITQRLAKYSFQLLNRSPARWILSKRCLYFAYGANLDSDLLLSKHIKPKSSETAVLASYEIKISSPCEWIGKGYASVASKSGSSVYGVLHDITTLELIILDLLEWLPFGFHKRMKMTIKSLKDHRYVDAWVYVAKFPKDDLKTTLGYRNLILRNAKALDFPESYVKHIEDLPVADSFSLDHGFRLSNPGKRRVWEKAFLSTYKAHDELREKLCQKLP